MTKKKINPEDFSRDEVNQHISDFIAAGGTINEIPTGLSAELITATPNQRVFGSRPKPKQEKKSHAPLMRVQELADSIGCTRQRIDHLIRAGKITAQKASNGRLISVSEQAKARKIIAEVMKDE